MFFLYWDEAALLLLLDPKAWQFVRVPSSITVLQSMKLGIDVNRHKEIIVKAISALLLLLLKHFKLNHVYQVAQTHTPPVLPSTGTSHHHFSLLWHYFPLSSSRRPPAHTDTSAHAPPLRAYLHYPPPDYPVKRAITFLLSSSSTPPSLDLHRPLTPHNLMHQPDTLAVGQFISVKTEKGGIWSKTCSFLNQF